jgi:putative CocE/NonD family hydrolase
MSGHRQEAQDLTADVHVWKDVEIPMADGKRLAARIWLPSSAQQSPVPAILEYIPYRHADGTAPRDALTHPYFAAHGYASVRVDLRGSGNSEGVLTDEYLQSELDDGVQVIEWLAQQPWCNGNVGMMGISWGGFNALQIAALQPPALKAIITVCSTDDRYADDVHYMGGCLLGDNLSWASVMFAFNSLPPDPRVVGPKWKAMWEERLEHSGLWLKNWLRHQRRDQYWKHGSVCEDYSAIQCPVFAISGWADGYSNAVFRMMEKLDVPRLGLVGPWSHRYPHMGVPGPAIGFLQEALRWWDQWLVGKDTQIMNEPMLRLWIQDSVEPSTGYAERPGHWIAERSWPSPNLAKRRFWMDRQHVLSTSKPGDQQRLVIRSPLSTGLYGGKWCSYSAPPDLPDDQRNEDGGALVFDTEPFARSVQFVGAPTVEVVVESDQPVAMLAARLSDVHPDGKATRISYGLLNLTHRDSHEAPSPLTPGKPYRVTLQLNELAQIIPEGHRLRLALSSSYWPIAWPAPKLTTLQLHLHESSLLLPVREPQSGDQLVHFAPVVTAPKLPVTLVEPGQHSWRVIRDLATDVATLEVLDDKGTVRLDDGSGLAMWRRTEERYSVSQRDVDSLRGETRTTRGLRRPNWEVRTTTRTVLTSDSSHFHVRAELDAWVDDRRFYSRNWDTSIKRDLV